MSAYGSQRKPAARWPRLIASYLRSGRPRKSLQAYLSMLDEGLHPDLRTFMLLFKACGSSRDIETGKVLYAHACDLGFTSDPFVSCSLLNMFGKCGDLLSSEELFQHVPDGKRDIVFWNSMLSAYAEQGHDDKVLQLYRQMPQKLVSPDHTTYAVAIRACASLAETEASPAFAGNHNVKLLCLDIGQALHADARRNKLASNAMVASSLTCLYGKCGVMAKAENTIINLVQPINIVTWTAFMSACIEDGQAKKALQIYLKMHDESITPDQHVFSMVLQACVLLAEKEKVILMDGEKIKAVPLIIGQALHIDATRQCFLSNVFVASILVTVYSKCGALLRAENVFKKFASTADLVLLTSLLSAYVEHGQTDKALELYEKMRVSCFGLDSMALACILQACGESGRLHICRQVHFYTISYGYDSSCFLESCLSYAYGACSCSEDALAVFSKLVMPDYIAWNASISGYVREGNCKACMEVLERMQATGSIPNGIAFFSILCTCSHGGYICEGIEFFDSMSRDYGMHPDSKHYAIVLDLVARVGDFSRAKNISEQMPTEVDLPFASCLLSACLKHGNLELGEEVFEYASELQPHDYVVMSNLYAENKV